MALNNGKSTISDPDQNCHDRVKSKLPLVLFHNPAAFIGGGEKGLLNCVKSLEGLIDPLVVLPGEGQLTKELRARGIRVEIVEIPKTLERVSRLGNKILSLLRGMPALPTYLKRLQETIVKNEPAILYSNGLKSHFLMGVLAKWNGLPLVCHVRDVLSSVPGLHYLLGNVASEVITNSQATLLALHLPKGRGVVIKNAIDLPLWDEESSFPVPPIVTEIREKGGNLIVTAGKLVPLKGFTYVIRAISLMVEEGMDVHLAIAGSEDYATQGGHGKELKELIQSLQLEARITLLGNVSPLAPLLKKANLFCLASESEGFGRVVAEAMASCCPVIATKVGGLRELIGDNEERGLLFEVGNVVELSQKMTALLKDSKRREELVRQGRRYVEEELALDKFRDELKALLERHLPTLKRDDE